MGIQILVGKSSHMPTVTTPAIVKFLELRLLGLWFAGANTQHTR